MIKVINLSKNYGDLVALDNINVSLDKKIYGLLGPNGSGKTTLLRILTTTLVFEEGVIEIDGENFHDNEQVYLNSIAYVPQQQELPGYFSVESFLYYIASYKGVRGKHLIERIENLLISLNLSDKRKSKVQNLSGGMKQRVLIAQALLNEPKIILLDEPTVGLDPVERRNFRELISTIAKNRTIVLATHVISDIEYIAEELILLKDGKVIAQDTQEMLLDHTKVFECNESEYLVEVKDKIEHKVVNIRKSINGVIYRYISRKGYHTPQETTLDDVYIDWLS